MYKNLFPTIENIRQQSGEFFKELSKEINSLKNKYPKVIRWNDTQGDILSKIITKYTNLQGLKVIFSLNEPIAYVYHKELLKTLYPKAKEELKSYYLEGSIDYRTGKVKGFWSTTEIVIVVGTQFANSTTSEQLAAVILHEVGHALTVIDITTSNRYVNVTLNQALIKYNDDLTLDTKRVIITDLLKTLKSKNLSVDELIKLKSKDAISLAITNEEVQQLKGNSIFKSNLNDASIIETLADDYVVKQGASKHLYEAFEDNPNYLISLKKENEDFMYFDLVVTPTVGMTTVGLLVVNPVIGLASLLVWASVLLVQSKNIDLNYASGINRMHRIKLALIERIKDESLPLDLRQSSREDLNELDKFISNEKNYYPIAIRVVGTLFNTMGKRRMDAEEFELELEKLASNKLFIKAFDLKHNNQ